MGVGIGRLEYLSQTWGDNHSNGAVSTLGMTPMN